MTELSEAQEWVLRTLLKYDCYIYIGLPGHDSGGRARYGGFRPGEMPYVVRRIPPRVSTITALLDKELIQRKKLLGFILTPKGREKAKELQDEEAK